MKEDTNIEVAQDDDFVDLGEVSLETEGNPMSINEGLSSVTHLD